MPTEQPEHDGSVVLRCPRCGKSDVVPSMPRGILDEARVSWGKVPKHCRSCGKRFWVRRETSAPADAKSPSG